MSYTVFIVIGFSISIAAIIGWIRVRKIDSAYFPFLYVLWIGLATEIISYIITHLGYSNSVLYNIYVLIEAILITLQFQRWQLFERVKFLFIALLISYVIFWSVECFFFDRISATASYFRLYYSVVIVLMSIDVLNATLMRESRNILKDPIFLICIAFIISPGCTGSAARGGAPQTQAHAGGLRSLAARILPYATAMVSACSRLGIRVKPAAAMLRVNTSRMMYIPAIALGALLLWARAASWDIRRTKTNAISKDCSTRLPVSTHWPSRCRWIRPFDRDRTRLLLLDQFRKQTGADLERDS